MKPTKEQIDNILLTLKFAGSRLEIKTPPYVYTVRAVATYYTMTASHIVGKCVLSEVDLLLVFKTLKEKDSLTLITETRTAV